MIGCSPMYWVVRDEGDPYADDVIAHLWFDGDTIDRSQFAATYTISGGGTLGAGQTKFGATSWDSRYTAGGNFYDARIGCSGTHLSPGNTEFTVEFWYYEPAAGAPGNQGHFIFTNNSNGHVFRIYSPSFKGDISFDLTGGGATPSSVSVSRSAWHHVALTRNGSSYVLWINGVSSQTATNTSLNTGTHRGTTCVVNFASLSSPGTAFASYYSNFRFTKKCRYTATFSVPTAPFPDPVP